MTTVRGFETVAERPPQPPDVDEVLEFLADRPLVVLTGAGCSTDSGIPDYRGPDSPARTPMTYQEFVSGPHAQQRYWGRSHLGWGRMRQAEPNAGHHALARIDPELLITQNVDGLHERAGSRRVVALHGRVAEVVCLGCRAVTTRSALHERLTELNPGFAERHLGSEVRPDGDVELDETHDFVVAGCAGCGGLLKPHVVFFGENVPVDRVERCYVGVDALADNDGALLVAGSSLTVMSGFRFVRRAAKAGTPVVIVNRGETRGDQIATYRLHLGTSEFLTALEARRGQSSDGEARGPVPRNVSGELVTQRLGSREPGPDVHDIRALPRVQVGRTVDGCEVRHVSPISPGAAPTAPSPRQIVSEMPEI